MNSTKPVNNHNNILEELYRFLVPFTMMDIMCNMLSGIELMIERRNKWANNCSNISKSISFVLLLLSWRSVLIINSKNECLTEKKKFIYQKNWLFLWNRFFSPRVYLSNRLNSRILEDEKKTVSPNMVQPTVKYISLEIFFFFFELSN